MDAQTVLSLKIKFGDDLRRFSVSQEVSYSDLSALVSKHFAIPAGNVLIKYVDDEEELITLGSDLELQEAKRLQPSVLRLSVFDVTPTAAAAHNEAPAWQCTFVRDVTIPENATITANEKFEKIWRVQNNGSVAWPAGVMLKAVDPIDDQLTVLSNCSLGKPVAPGEEVNVSVLLQAPARVGRSVSYWRMFTKDGEAFGGRLLLEIYAALRSGSGIQSAKQEEPLQEEEEAAAERRQSEEAKEAAVREKLRLDAEKLKIEQEAMQASEEARRKCEAEEHRVKEEERRAKEEEHRAKEEEERKRKDTIKSSKYPAELTQMYEMGFVDMKRNIDLLNQFRGNLNLALEALFN